MSQHRNQRKAVLDLLTSARGREVPAYELAKCALQYTARICELRRQGFRILNRVARQSDGKIFGFYRLDLGTSRTIKPLPNKPQPPTQPTLFGNIGPLPD